MTTGTWSRAAAGGGLAVLGGLLAWLSVSLGPALGYMPHGHCYLWQPGLLLLHVGSDLAIGTAYFAISGTLAYLVYRARDEIPFHWMFLAFGAFIVACGATHFMEVWVIWQPRYILSGNVKLVTALVSMGTAVLLPPLVPRVLALARAEELARDRARQLDQRSALLAHEQAARREAETVQRDAEAARWEAEAANRAKDEFLAVVSHELRNPLSPILAWSRMLLVQPFDAPTVERALGIIERNARAQAALIDDLLDVSRIVSGRLRLDVRPIELAPVIEAAVESLRVSAEARQIELHVVLDPRSGMIAGDPNRVQQVVWNLVSNAVKFTPKGGRVQVRLERVNSHLELSVSDTGRGLDADEMPRVFEPFWQSDRTTTRTRGGLGLGLAIVRHLVELHGGSVEAHSGGLDQGTVVRARFPLMVVTPDATSPARRHPTAGAAGPRGGCARLDGVRVLVVDDEPDANDLVQSLLAAVGAEVRVAASARQAIEILDRWMPDVLVSDIGMPGEDGYALIAEVRARGRARGGHVPAVALTAYARTEDRVRVLAAGFQMHVVKPLDPVELTFVVASLARRGTPSRAPG